jgi:hypothetical protein
MAEVGRSLRFLNIVFAIWLIAASIILKAPSGIENMEGNKKMMGSMMQGEGMQLMMKDITMMRSMMNGMMKDGKMMGTMMQIMYERA